MGVDAILRTTHVALNAEPKTCTLLSKVQDSIVKSVAGRLSPSIYRLPVESQSLLSAIHGRKALEIEHVESCTAARLPFQKKKTLAWSRNFKVLACSMSTAAVLDLWQGMVLPTRHRKQHSIESYAERKRSEKGETFNRIIKV